MINEMHIILSISFTDFSNMLMIASHIIDYLDKIILNN